MLSYIRPLLAVNLAILWVSAIVSSATPPHAVPQGFADVRLPSDDDIQVFIHVHAKGNWSQIFMEQLFMLVGSGLMDHASAIHVYINKLEPSQDLGYASRLNEIYGEKFDVTIAVASDLYERLTLHDIRNHVNLRTRFLYLHSKGVTHQGSGNAPDTPIACWRHQMEYFLVRHWRTCVCLLNSQRWDTVGANLRNPGNNVTEDHWKLHYAGNFFWSTGAWWLGLQETIGPDYRATEMHLLSGMKDKKVKPRAAWIARGTNLYEVSLTPAKYTASARWAEADALGCAHDDR